MLDISSMNSYYNSMKTIISEKGQITIPKKVRDMLGLAPGTEIDITAREGRLVGIKTTKTDSVHRWRGKGTLPGTFNGTDEYLKAIRE